MIHHNIYSANRHIPTIKTVALKLIIEAQITETILPHILCYFIFYDTNIDKNTIITINDIKQSFFNSISSNLYIGYILSLSKLILPYVILLIYSII